jgi:hypothetical protein
MNARSITSLTGSRMSLRTMAIMLRCGITPHRLYFRRLTAVARTSGLGEDEAATSGFAGKTVSTLSTPLCPKPIFFRQSLRSASAAGRVCRRIHAGQSSRAILSEDLFVDCDARDRAALGNYGAVAMVHAIQNKPLSAGSRRAHGPHQLSVRSAQEAPAHSPVLPLNNKLTGGCNESC